MKLAFVHILETANTGDRVSAPYHYFDFPEYDLYHAGHPIHGEYEAIIYGGGAIAEWLIRSRFHEKQRGLKIGWGIGRSEHSKRKASAPPSGFDLLGYRDVVPEYEWVPCASCMSHLFDDQYPATHEYVFFYNEDPKIGLPSNFGTPIMGNTMPMNEIVPFLAKGRTVVTNSYHGVYWATLLGRKVIVSGAYSSKFYGFRHPPTIARNWASGLRGTKSYPTALARARAANEDFYDKVRSMITHG